MIAIRSTSRVAVVVVVLLGLFSLLYHWQDVVVPNMNLSYGNGQEPLVAVIEKQAEYLVGEPTPSFRGES